MEYNKNNLKQLDQKTDLISKNNRESIQNFVLENFGNEVTVYTENTVAKGYVVINNDKLSISNHIGGTNENNKQIPIEEVTKLQYNYKIIKINKAKTPENFNEYLKTIIGKQIRIYINGNYHWCRINEVYNDYCIIDGILENSMYVHISQIIIVTVKN